MASGPKWERSVSSIFLHVAGVNGCFQTPPNVRGAIRSPHDQALMVFMDMVFHSSLGAWEASISPQGETPMVSSDVVGPGQSRCHDDVGGGGPERSSGTRDVMDRSMKSGVSPPNWAILLSTATQPKGRGGPLAIVRAMISILDIATVDASCATIKCGRRRWTHVDFC